MIGVANCLQDEGKSDKKYENATKLPYLKNPGQNRFSYQKPVCIYGIKGFIVNVHDATNYDIDLDIPEKIGNKYGNVISNSYTYKDLGYDFSGGFSLCPELEKKGKTYRCRLKGVGINHHNSWKNIWKQNQCSVEIKQLIDRTDGWVTCNLYNVDIYKRLLVDVIINTPSEKINLREFLLKKISCDGSDNIFYNYDDKISL